jgi:myo-inositol-1(or 4)-monophosphatase
MTDPGLTDPETLALEVAQAIRDAVHPHLGTAGARAPVSRAPGGDVTLAIDEVAERVLDERLAAEGDIGFYSEDRGLVVYGQPRAFLVVDPVDGTRPAAAGLESCCVSIGLVPPTEDARLGDVFFGVVQELRTGARYWARRGEGARATTLFFTSGQRGRPLVPTSIVLEELVDGASMGGGYFDLGSAAFALTRVADGRLDAYVDPGRRMVDDVPAVEPVFVEVGEGAVCTNFPYDVAAGVLIVAEAGGTVTHADGRPLHDHPAVGSSREHGLAVLAAGNAELHRRLLDALDRGMDRLARSVAQQRDP